MKNVSQENKVLKTRGFFVLFAILIFMYIMNSLTPLLNEDYFSSFVWPKGVPNLGVLPENATRVSSISDVLHNCGVYYMMEGGRLPGGLIVGALFWDLGKACFNPVNAVLMTLLVVEIYWLSHEGKVTFDFNSSYLIWIFFSLWAFNASFVDSCLWMSGSSNYLWMIVAVLAFLLPYVRNFYDNNSFNKDSLKMVVSMFFMGVLAGWSHETTICWLIFILMNWLYICKKRNELHNWKVAGFLGICLGYALLIFAPGNFSRLAMQQQANSGLLFSEIYLYKFNELAGILVFHFFLWYFILRFFIRKKNGINQTKIAIPYLILAKVCSIIAFGSGILMFLIPASTWRVSFLNLVFLTVAVASLFRMQEVTNICIIKDNVKVFLKYVGCSFFTLTVVVSLWCNYTNWNYWQDILALIKKEQQYPTSTVIYVHPYYTDEQLALRFASGFHLIYMPVVYGDENNKINAVVAKYYGIKGIAKKNNIYH